MSELIHDQVTKELLRGLANSEPFVNRLVGAYLQDLIAEGRLLLRSGNEEEDVMEYYRQAIMSGAFSNVVKAFIKGPDFEKELYRKSYERLKAFYEEYKNYGDLFTEIYEDEAYLNEIFVRLVEETQGVAITSAKQLQELTGIKEIYGYWDEEKGETVPYGDKKPTKKEAQEIAFKQVEGAFTSAMYWRYYRSLVSILESGGKYADLLQVKPSYFNLPETWSGCLAGDQHTTILWAIEQAFLIGEPNSSVRPDLRAIAEEIEAPYSVILEAHKISNGWKLQQ